MTTQEVVNLIQQLSADGINEEGISTRLINEGLSADEIDNLLSSDALSYENATTPVQLNKWLSWWVRIHFVIVGVSSFLLIMGFLPSFVSPGLIFVIPPLYVDVAIQLWCLTKLNKGESMGYYGLMRLFVVRTLILTIFLSPFFFVYLPINAIDALLLYLAYKSSTEEKRKTKLIEDIT
ncbi:MAG: hypothetical protein AAF846_20870 [Chloroflexota bacterium]